MYTLSKKEQESRIRSPKPDVSTPVGTSLHAEVNNAHYKNDVAYWSKRCELAESLIKSAEEVMDCKMSSIDVLTYEEWKLLQTIAYTF